MEEWLIYLTRQAVLLIKGFALIVVVFGAVQAFAVAARLFFYPNDTVFRPVWLRFGRWLVAGLTFQLAADIIETAITPSWEDIGRLAAIAVIRTFLNIFLERDLSELRERGEGADTA
ncbi:DUF1622 domain-containing protein [Bosea sp. BK604]|uniref:DUF1622 domain-containing protein n=1 Tax=Bosea sp. BK604 TaxID=2512180 RepID=UPI001052CDC2|nr:DUF1622 domain-containing protein [Bosea sp. BK604]TCR62924.1 putative membrane protein [Bosea sp. BK604]